MGRVRSEIIAAEVRVAKLAPCDGEVITSKVETDRPFHIEPGLRGFPKLTSPNLVMTV